VGPDVSATTTIRLRKLLTFKAADFAHKLSSKSVKFCGTLPDAFACWFSAVDTESLSLYLYCTFCTTTMSTVFTV